MTLAYILLSAKKNIPLLLLPGSARCYALGQRGPTQGRGGPLTPRPRGTIYEALPLILEHMWGILCLHVVMSLLPAHVALEVLEGLKERQTKATIGWLSASDACLCALQEVIF